MSFRQAGSSLQKLFSHGLRVALCTEVGGLHQTHQIQRRRIFSIETEETDSKRVYLRCFFVGRSLLSLVGSLKMKLTPRIPRCHIGVMIHWVRTGGSVDVGKLVVAVTRWSLGLS